jgi:hypothetical protein
LDGFVEPYAHDGVASARKGTDITVLMIGGARCLGE